uniref:Uncharacterized protein n=1 Tax=Triticum urartu TaxID=4572 RepID=A0A8R7RA74_TRIUA
MHSQAKGGVRQRAKEEPNYIYKHLETVEPTRPEEETPIYQRTNRPPTNTNHKPQKLPPQNL